MQQKNKVSYSVLVVLLMLIIFGVIAVFSSISTKAEDYYTESTTSYYTSSYYTSSYYTSSYYVSSYNEPYSSYPPYSSYYSYSSYAPYYEDATSYYASSYYYNYNGNSEYSYYENSYDTGYGGNYLSSDSSVDSYGRSSGNQSNAAGTISLLPENSGKDRGTTVSQNWNDLLKLVPSDVSSGVFTFDSSVAASAGGDWMTMTGFICIALGILGVLLVIFFQYLSPHSPRKMKKLYISKAIEYSNNYARRTSQSAKSVAKDYRNIYAKSSADVRSSANNVRTQSGKNLNYKDPYRKKPSGTEGNSRKNFKRRSNRYR